MPEVSNTTGQAAGEVRETIKKNWKSHVFVIVCFLFLSMFLFSSCFCHVLKLCSFNSKIHSALSIVGYHDRGKGIGKHCLLPEPIRLQDSQDTTRSRSKK